MQLAIVLILVAVAVAYVGYSAYQVFTGRSTGCSCHQEVCPRSGGKPRQHS